MYGCTRRSAARVCFRLPHKVKEKDVSRGERTESNG